MANRKKQVHNMEQPETNAECNISQFAALNKSNIKYNFDMIDFNASLECEASFILLLSRLDCGEAPPLYFKH